MKCLDSLAVEREEARTQGFRQGVEAAANVVEDVAENDGTVQNAAKLTNMIRALAPPVPSGPREGLVICDMYRHGAALGLAHVRQSDCVNPHPPPPASGAPRTWEQRVADVERRGTK